MNTTHDQRHFFYDNFIASYIFISTAAVLLCMQSQVELSLNVFLSSYTLFTFFATLLLYNFSRVAPLFSSKHFTLQNQWVIKHKPLWFLLMSIGLTGSIYFGRQLAPATIISILPAALLSVLYYMPFFSPRLANLSLRKLPYLKIFIIAFVWSWTTIVPIYIEQMANIEHFPLLHFIIRFIFILAITIPFDIRDIKDDAFRNVFTIPLKVGIHASRKIAILLLILNIGLLTLQYWIDDLKLSAFIPIVLACLITIIFIDNHYLQKRYYYYYGILDGTMLLMGSAVLLVHYLYY